MAIWEEARERQTIGKEGERQLLLRALEWGICLLLGAVLASARIFGCCAPFGIAAVAAAGTGLPGLMTLLGALLGYLFLQGAYSGLHYGAAAVLSFALLVALQEVKIARHRWFAPSVAAFFCALSSFVHLSGSGFVGGDVIFYMTEIAFVWGLALCYRAAFVSALGREGSAGVQSAAERAALLAIGASLLIALSGVRILGEYSLGRSLAAVAVMVAARYGVQTGLLGGAAAGLAMDLASGRGPYYSMVFALSGALAGFSKGKERLVTALSYVAASSAALLWTWQSGMRISLLYEVLLGALLFTLLPQRLWKFGAALLGERGPQAAEWSKTRDLTVGQLQRTAGAFRQLYESLRETFQREEGGTEDPSIIFRRSAGEACKRCKKRESCWQSGFQETQRALNDATGPMLARGRALEEDFPAHFRSQCRDFPAFLQLVNEELKGFLYRQQYEGRLREKQSMLYRQYAEFDRILGRAAAQLAADLTPDLPREAKLKGFLRSRGLTEEARVYYNAQGRLQVEIPRQESASQELTRARLSALLGLSLREAEESGGPLLRFQEAEPLRAVAGVYGRNKEGESISGDTGSWFRRDDGLLCILLCDGMGSGAGARGESGLAVRLLQSFLKAGVEPRAALATVNGALSLHGEATGGCTTIDLLTVDLYSGMCSIYKFGAAPSYLRKGSSVRRIEGGALPAGLPNGAEAKAEASRFRAHPGDWIILLSDGLLGGEGDAWLREQLKESEESSPGKLAQTLLEESRKHGGEQDDCTVIALRLEKRAEAPPQS